MDHVTDSNSTAFVTELLENSEAYFPKVFEALRQARREILLETFILFEDKVGHELQGILINTARMLYDYLLKDGVVIHEYCQRPLLIALVMYLGVEAKAKALRMKKTPA